MATERVGATFGARLVEVITNLDVELPQLDGSITARFNDHEDAAHLLAMPGFGSILAATFLVTPDVSVATTIGPANSSEGSCGYAT